MNPTIHRAGAQKYEGGSIFRAGIWLAVLHLRPFIIAYVAFFWALLVMRPVVTGDEPHYMLYADSLAFDRDIDLRNQYQSSISSRYYVGGLLEPHATEARGDGELLSTHQIGLPLLIVPAVMLSRGVLAVRLELLVLSALLAHHLFRILELMAPGRAALHWLVWIAAVLTMPIITYSGQVYPEIPAALLAAYALRVALEPRIGKTRLILASVAVAGLPWLQLRFLPVAGALALGLGYRALGAQRPSIRDLLRWSALRSGTVRTALIPVTSLGFSVATFAISLFAWYGTISLKLLMAPGAQVATWSTLPSFAYRFGLGSILSPSFGWLPFAPVHLLALAGLGLLVVRFGRTAWLGLATAGTYIAQTFLNDGAGWCYPARYLVVLVPFASISLLITVTSSRLARVLFVPLAILSLTIAGVGISNPQALYPTAGGTRLPIVSELREIWPTFDEPVQRNLIDFSLAAAQLHHRVGHLIEHSDRENGDQVEALQAMPWLDPPGELASGAVGTLPSGAYTARFQIAAAEGEHTAPVGTLAIRSSDGERYATRDVWRADVSPSSQYETIEVPFASPGDKVIETSVDYTGVGELRFYSVQITSASTADWVSERFTSWAKTSAWLLLTALVSRLIVVSASPRTKWK